LENKKLNESVTNNVVVACACPLKTNGDWGETQEEINIYRAYVQRVCFAVITAAIASRKGSRISVHFEICEF